MSKDRIQTCNLRSKWQSAKHFNVETLVLDRVLTSYLESSNCIKFFLIKGKKSKMCHFWIINFSKTSGNLRFSPILNQSSGTWTFCLRRHFGIKSFWHGDMTTLEHFGTRIFQHLDILTLGNFSTMQSNMYVSAKTFWRLCQNVHFAEISMCWNLPVRKGHRTVWPEPI